MKDKKIKIFYDDESEFFAKKLKKKIIRDFGKYCTVYINRESGFPDKKYSIIVMVGFNDVKSFPGDSSIIHVFYKDKFWHMVSMLKTTILNYEKRHWDKISDFVSKACYTYIKYNLV